MNLQTEIGELRSLLAEPYRSNDSDAFFTNPECARWIYSGEMAAFNSLPDDALASMAVDSGSISLSGASGFNSGTDATVNWSRVLGVYVDRNGLSVRARIVSAAEFYAVRHSPEITNNKQQPAIATIEGQSVRIQTSDQLTACVVKYLPVPTQRSKYYRGTTTAAGSNVAVVDATAGGIFSTAAWFNGCRLLMQTGPARGVESLVSGWATNTYTVGDLGATSSSGSLYDVGQVSSLPPELYPAWMAYAAFLAANKKAPEKAAGLYAAFENLVSRISARYAKGSPARADIQQELET